MKMMISGNTKTTAGAATTVRLCLLIGVAVLLTAPPPALASPSLELNCLRASSTFSVLVHKNGMSYVEVYAKDRETDSDCKVVSSDAAQTSFFYNVTKDECGVTFDEEEGFYTLKIYVAGQAVVLTAQDTLYEASCSFEAKLYTVNSTNDNSRTRSGGGDGESGDNETADGLNYMKVWEENSIDGLNLKLFNLENNRFTNTAKVGDEIKLVLTLNSSASFLPKIDYSVECFLYSDDSKSMRSQYKLTTNTGCSASTNELFNESIRQVTVGDPILQSDEYGLETPSFKAPFYDSTGKLFFECLVELCGSSGETCGGSPQCEQRQTQRSYGGFADSDIINSDGMMSMPPKTNSRKIGSLIYIIGEDEEENDGTLTKMRTVRGGKGQKRSGVDCYTGSRNYAFGFFVSSLIIIAIAIIVMGMWMKWFLEKTIGERRKEVHII